MRTLLDKSMSRYVGKNIKSLPTHTDTQTHTNAYTLYVNVIAVGKQLQTN